MSLPADATRATLQTNATARGSHHDGEIETEAVGGSDDIGPSKREIAIMVFEGLPGGCLVMTGLRRVAAIAAARSGR